MKKAIAIDPKDNVATLLTNVKPGEEVEVQLGENSFELPARGDIPFGHKVALNAIRKGDNVIKYGEVIGRASLDVERGALVHVHNLESLRGRGDLK